MPPNPQNLRPPWKPGETGNPNGYSRKRRVTDALVDLLDEKKGTADRALATRWLSEALKGDPRFFAMLLERIEGKIVQPIADATPMSLADPFVIPADDDRPEPNAESGLPAAEGS